MTIYLHPDDLSCTSHFFNDGTPNFDSVSSLFQNDVKVLKLDLLPPWGKVQYVWYLIYCIQYVDPVCGPHIQKSRKVRLYNILNLPNEGSKANYRNALFWRNQTTLELQYRAACHLSWHNIDKDIYTPFVSYSLRSHMTLSVLLSWLAWRRLNRWKPGYYLQVGQDSFFRNHSQYIEPYPLYVIQH
jgi:hypothetical protein